jgi:hypothetical protein
MDRATWLVLLMLAGLFLMPGTPEELARAGAPRAALAILGYGPDGENITVDAPIIVSFGEPMNEITVNISITPQVALAPSWDSAGRNLTMSHPPFTGLTTYNVTVRAGALSQAGAALVSDLTWEFTTVLLPGIIEHSPAGEGVALSSPIRLRFNGPMNASTVNVTVEPRLNLLPFWFGEMDTLSLAHEGFWPDTTYNVTLAPGARFASGEAMAGGLSWSFSTATRPRVLSVSPEGANVRVDAPIRIAFSQRMNPSTVLVRVSPNVALDPSWSADGKNLTLGHASLPDNTTFNLTVPSGAASMDATRLDTDYPWEFTTILFPRVVSFSPTGVNMPLTTTFSLEFNKPMNLSSCIGAFAIDPPVKGAWKTLDGGRVLAFTPAAKLRAGADYSIRLNGSASDLGGNALGKESRWAFTTAAAPVSGQEGFPWWVAVLMLVMLAAAVAAYALWRRSKRPVLVSPQEQEPAGDSLTPEEAPAPAAPETAPVEDSALAVAGESHLEPGLVRLELTVANRSDEDVDRAVLKLVYDENALSLASVRPAYTLKGDDIQIGAVKAQSSLAITADFRPSAVGRTEVGGVLVFKDGGGRLATAQMQPVVVLVERPVFQTESNITTSKMMERIVGELDFSAPRIFGLPKNIRPKKAFEIGKAAVSRHDLRLVCQFSEHEPYVGEAWYFGQSKGTGDSAVVRVRFFEDRDALEFFILARTPALLNGLALSLKEDLIQALLSAGCRPSIREMTGPDEVRDIITRRTLLDRESPEK